MASSSLSTTTITRSASASVFSKNSSSLVHYYRNATFSFRLSSSFSKLRFVAKGSQPNWKCPTVVKAQLNEVSFYQWFSFEDVFSNFRSFLDSLLGSPVALKVSGDGPSNAAATPAVDLDVQASESKDSKPSNEPSPSVLAEEESISEFISQVSSLVKLVDSRDIVELQLKQLDCELIIRKKEALPQPTAPAPVAVTHLPSTQPVMPPTPPAPTPTSSGPPASPAAALTSSPAGKSAKHLLPPLKCPMAGTFYRSPAPGEPPLVKVGDKVQKGQVLCIIEAMKLMNEIEADQSGTIVEILAEDGKPVSVDTPLFVIAP